MGSLSQLFYGQVMDIIFTYPVQLSGLIWCLGRNDVFSKLSKEPDRKFIQWAEQYLSDGKADPCHSKGLSFKNCMVRIPGTY